MTNVRLWFAVVGLGILWITTIIVISAVLSTEINKLKSNVEKVQQELPLLLHSEIMNGQETTNDRVTLDVCQYGRASCSPAASCHHIFQKNPLSESGYYWITSSSGKLERVYCAMDTTCGKGPSGWRRIAKYDFHGTPSFNQIVSDSVCPAGWCSGLSSCYPCSSPNLPIPCRSIRIPVGSNSSSVSEICANMVFRIDALRNATVTSGPVGTIEISRGSQTLWHLNANIGNVTGAENCGSFPAEFFIPSSEESWIITILVPVYCMEYVSVPVEYSDSNEVVVKICHSARPLGEIEVSLMEFFIA